MAMIFRCDRCKKEVKKAGYIRVWYVGRTWGKGYSLCKSCFEGLETYLKKKEGK